MNCELGAARGVPSKSAPSKIKPGGTSSRGTGHPPRVVSRRSNSTPHHPGISVASHSWPCFKLCGGNIRHEFFAHCSTTELRLLSPPAGIEPATHGSDVACAFFTPQIFSARSRVHSHLQHAHASPLFYGRMLLCPELRRARPKRPDQIDPSQRESFPGGTTAHSLSGFEPETFRPYQK